MQSASLDNVPLGSLHSSALSRYAMEASDFLISEGARERPTAVWWKRVLLANLRTPNRQRARLRF